MTLPSSLQPWWPFFKRGHRLLTRLSGALFRVLSPLFGSKGVPRHATESSLQTAAAEPDIVKVSPGSPSVEITASPRYDAAPGDGVFELTRSAAVAATFVLEINGGRLTGDFGAATTPAKVLDHETSTYFGVADWREHPIFLRPTLGELEHVPGTVLSLTTRGTTQNYYHFLYDSIARFGIFEQCLPGRQYDAVIVPHGTRYQRQFLELAGITGRLIQPERGRTVSADRLLVPSNPNWALQAPPSMVEWLRSRLKPSGAAVEVSRRLYLTRGNVPNTRRYVQEPELWPELEKRGFTMVDPGKFTVQEQIDMFHQAEVVVSPHGAALTNLTFSEPGVRVLELFASDYVHLGLWAICRAIDAEYNHLVGDGPQRSNSANSGVLNDVSMKPARVLEAVDTMLG